MKSAQKSQMIKWIAGLVLTIAGLVGYFVVRPQIWGLSSKEIAENLQFITAVSLISLFLGVVLFISGISAYGKKLTAKTMDVRKLTTAALFAALSYISFMFLRIDIPVGTEKTAFHLGNTFCVLAALILDGFWGGMAGAVGMTIADLTSGYVTSAPKTFLLKLCIGLIAGLVAHKCFHINQITDKKKLLTASLVSAIAGLSFNVVADPVVGYFYKTWLMGIPQEAAKIWAKIGAMTTLVNAVLSIIAAVVLYLALRPAMRRMGISKTEAR